MNKIDQTRRLPFAAALLGLALVACTQAPPAAVQPAAAAQTAELAELLAERADEDKNLTNFDDLDFNVYSGQKWDELSRSHAPDIVVHWPDGRTTTGIDAHIADLKQQFVFAPDTKIKEHPIKIARGNYTAVQGVMTGTFSQPMPIADGKHIAPTNKSFRLEMVTIGRWENGVMREEWLIWDNQSFMRQVGLAQ